MIIRRIFFFLSLMAGAVSSQLPEYAQQYRQRLGGAIDELHRMLDDFDRDAASSGMDRPGGVARLQRDPDPFVQQRGVRVREAEARVDRLESQLQEFSNAGSFGRLEALARNFDPGVARRAYQSYEPAVPLTIEGGVIAVVGFLVTLLTLRLAGGGVSRLRRRAKRRARVHVA